VRRLRVLAACECSGRVRDAFAARGWEAWSADLLPSETPAITEFPDRTIEDNTPGDWPLRNFHYQGDVRDLFSWDHPVNGSRDRYRRLDNDGADVPLWDLFLGFPPCTHLAQSGAVWWKQKRADGRQDEAAAFFMNMVNAPSPLVAVENPRGDMTRRYREPDQYVQPYMFGDPLKKLTGLWLKGLPLLVPDAIVEPEPAGRVATGGGSWRTDQKHGHGANNGHEDSEGRARRQIVRNRTLPGLARAVAEQWGTFAEEYYACPVR
jgi:hypothetical protein